MSDITQLLAHLQQGVNREAESELLALVYAELHRMASVRMARESLDNTLSPTALVHQVYLRLCGNGNTYHWQDRQHFFAAAAEAMRRILVDRARRRNAAKRGGSLRRRHDDVEPASCDSSQIDLLALNEAIERLGQRDARAAQLVKLRFFAGLTGGQAAEIMQLSGRSADRLWSVARAWLYAELNDNE
jgi:RNA polymerase sigma factor (TIGR02999 family)